MDRLVKANDLAAVIKSWDALVPIGTPCTVGGDQTKTWSHAGRMGPKRREVPCVFVESQQEPVPLAMVHVEGVVMER